MTSLESFQRDLQAGKGPGASEAQEIMKNKYHEKWSILFSRINLKM